MDLKRPEESNGPNAELGDAFVAQPSAELVALYGGWSDNHEDHMDGFGYSHPMVFMLLLKRYVLQANAKVPNAEVRIGIVGHNTIDGIDIS